MRSERFELNSYKTENIFVTAKNSMHRSVDINSVMLGNILVQLAPGVQNLGFVFDNQLKLDEQINNDKKNVIIDLISFSRIALPKFSTNTQK